MKTIIVTLLGTILLKCSTRAETEYITRIWDELGHTPFSDVRSGVPAYEASIISYRRADRDALKIRLGKPVIVAAAKQGEKWGFFQFPIIYRGLDNILVAKWHMAPDAVSSYGRSSYGMAVSHDGGESWSPREGPLPMGDGLLLANGDRIKAHTPPALKVEDLQLPEPVGSTFRRPESKSEVFTYYKLEELPQSLQGVYISRLPKGETRWRVEHAALEEPRAVRYSRSGLFPVVWWGDMHIAADGAVMAGIYPSRYLKEDGKIDPSGISFYRSVDEGRTWKIHSRIPYMPDLKADPSGDKRLAVGFTEPCFEILSDGSFLCVTRSSDGGVGPMYFCRSVDLGRTWSRPIAFTRNGVRPRLLQLKNGVIVLASGRPGVQLRFSTDGKGENWTDPFEMLSLESFKQTISCGYTELLATGPDRFLLIYSDFLFRNQAGESRKAIKVREIKLTVK